MIYSYTCKHTYPAEEDYPEETMEWKCTLEIIRQTDSLIEVEVKGRGSSFDMVIGAYVHGDFLCIPDLNVSCPIGGYHDTFWNMQQIWSSLDNETDAVTIAFGIQKLGQILQAGGDFKNIDPGNLCA